VLLQNKCQVKIRQNEALDLKGVQDDQQLLNSDASEWSIKQHTTVRGMKPDSGPGSVFFHNLILKAKHYGIHRQHIKKFLCRHRIAQIFF